MTPTPAPLEQTTSTKIGGHEFLFRRLNWREELSFAGRMDMKGIDPRRVILANHLVSVNGKTMGFEEALRVMRALRVPVLERAYMVVIGGLPGHRKFSAEGLYVAPDVRKFSKKVYQEEEETEVREEAFLENLFGQKEVAEEREMEAAILRNSGKQGAVKLDPFSGQPLEETR